MEILDAGHDYLLRSLDGAEQVRLTFVKRNKPPEKFPGNHSAYPGTTTQEVLRALIERAFYVNGQIAHDSNLMVIANLRDSIFELERRAAERHGRELRVIQCVEDIENMPTCSTCGHIRPEFHEECKSEQGK